MQWTNPNTGDIVWSRTAKDLVLEDCYGPIDFRIELNGAVAATFTLTAISYRITLRFRDILEAILPENGNLPASDSAVFRFSDTVEISATMYNTGDSPATLSTGVMTCIRGGSDELSPEFPHDTHWLTWKPQVTDTWAWARERLACVVPARTGVTVTARIYYAFHSPETVTLASFPSQNTASVCIVDCSLSRIEALSGVTNETIVAYDIRTGTVFPHRFIVRRTRLIGREFLFMNSFGVPDTVFATGMVSRESVSEVALIRINHEDREIANKTVERFKIQTGFIRDRRAMDQWQEFVRSKIRFVMLQGDVPRRIVVDGTEFEMTEHTLSSAVVSYHFANAFTGRYYDDTELEDYEYTAAE